MRNIEAKVLSGQSDFLEKNISHGAWDSASGRDNDDYDHRGEHTGDWGARGDSDIFGGSNSANNGRSIDMQCWRDSTQDTTWHCIDYRTGESYDTNTP